MKKVVAIDRAFPSYDRLIAELNKLDAHIVYAEDKSEAALSALCADADAVMVTFTQVTAKIIDAMKPGSMIVRTGIGVDNIDIAAAKARGVQVSFVPDYCREEVADHSVALALDAVRKISFCNRHVREDWNMTKRMGYVPRLRGCVVGILSFGAIGQMIAERMKPFGVELWAYDPYLPEERFAALGVKNCKDQDEVFTGADILILTGPLTPERFHIVNQKSLSRMKKTAVLVNTARGPLVDENALIAALKSGTIEGAALDVFEKEPIENTALYDLENLIITPHTAFYSESALPDLINKVFDEVIRALKGEPLRNHV